MYRLDDTINPNLVPIIEYMKLRDLRFNMVQVQMVRSDAIRGNRAGMAPNCTRVFAGKSACILPFVQMSIRASGEVGMCCEDALGRYTLGDVTRDSIMNIWNGPRYQIARHQVAGGRHKLSLCKDCNASWPLDFKERK